MAVAAAYVATLAFAHEAKRDAFRPGAFVQTSAAATMRRANAVDRDGSLVLGTWRAHAARASWSFRERDIAAPSGTRFYAFVIGEPPEFYRADGEATIAFGGRIVARFTSSSLARGHGPFGLRGPPRRTLAIPPSSDPGWLIPLAADACARNHCSLQLAVTGGAWTVQRLGFISAVGPVDGRSPAGSIVPYVVALGLGIIVFFASSIVRATVRERFVAGAAVAVLGLGYASLLSYQSGVSGSDRRSDRVEHLGAEVANTSGASTVSGNALTIAGRHGHPAEGVWQLDSYESTHDAQRAGQCTAAIYVVGSGPAAFGRNASATVSLDGRSLADIRFGPSRIEFPAGEGELVPRNVTPKAIFFTPLYQPFGLDFAVPPEACATALWNVRIVLHDAHWKIERVGAVFDFTPVAPGKVESVANGAVAAVLLVCLALVAGVVILAAYRRFGVTGTAAVLFLLACAPLTHDEWDFPIWLRFTDLAAFGHGNPGEMWLGTPLWPLVAASLSPLLVASYALTGHASQEVTATGLKLAMALALAINALAIGGRAPGAYRRVWFFSALLAPVGIYELFGGYRETFAATLALAGFALARRGQLSWAAFAFALATSITECLIPLVALPAALATADSRTARGWRRAAAVAAIAVGTLTAEWLFLGPHAPASRAVVARVVSYRYGGASWFAIADGYGALPAWVGPHSLAIVAVLFLILAAPPAWIVLRRAAGPGPLTSRTRRDIEAAFVALVAAVFLSYRGIDPNDWYALFVIVAYFFVTYEPANPFPLVLGAAQGLSYYSIVGIGNFVDWTYFEPVDRGLLGVLGLPMLVTNGLVNLLILAAYIGLVAGNTRMLFSRGTARYASLFVASALTACSQNDGLDAVVVLGSIVALALVAFRLLRIYVHAPTPMPPQAATFAAMATIAVAYLTIFPRTPAAGLTAISALLYGTIDGFGLCDVAFVVCGIWMLAAGQSFGYVSIAGWTLLSLLAADALYRGCRARFANANLAQA